MLSRRTALPLLLALVACESKVKVGEFFDTDSAGESDGTTGPGESGGQDGTTGSPGDASGTAQTGAGESSGEDTGAGSSTTGAPAPDAEVAALCQDFLDDLRSGQTGECECLVLAGLFEDVETCLAPKEAILAEVHGCRCGVLAMFPDAAPGVECLAGAANSLSTCLATWTCTDDYPACTDPFLASACDLPPAAEAMLAAQCQPAEFVCGSGEAVLVTSRCDVKADCEDQSDEKDCP